MILTTILAALYTKARKGVPRIAEKTPPTILVIGRTQRRQLPAKVRARTRSAIPLRPLATRQWSQGDSILFKRSTKHPLADAIGPCGLLPLRGDASAHGCVVHKSPPLKQEAGGNAKLASGSERELPGRAASRDRAVFRSGVNLRRLPSVVGLSGAGGEFQESCRIKVLRLLGPPEASA